MMSSNESNAMGVQEEELATLAGAGLERDAAKRSERRRQAISGGEQLEPRPSHHRLTSGEAFQEPPQSSMRNFGCGS